MVCGQLEDGHEVGGHGGRLEVLVDQGHDLPAVDELVGVQSHLQKAVVQPRLGEAHGLQRMSLVKLQASCSNN